MIEGVIFDLGSTLIQFRGSWQEVSDQGARALAAALSRRGLAFDPDAFRAAFSGAMDAYARARRVDHLEPGTASVVRSVLSGFTGSEVPTPLVEGALEELYAVSEALWVPAPAVREVLSRLQASGLRLGLISNAADAANVDRLLDLHDLRPFFDPILVSAAFGVRKPDASIFEAVLENWGLPASSVVMVGDTLVDDVLGAQEVGMHQIWLETQADRQDNLDAWRRVEPEATAAALDEVPELIEALDGRPPP